jgi:hypothetical protein
MEKQPYRTLHEFMEKTGTNATWLIKMVEAETGVRLSNSLISQILRGSRRCSRWNAFALHVVTGVPMEELLKWPRIPETENSRSVA